MTVFHPAFIYYDQYIAAWRNMRQNMLIATAAMFVVSLVLILLLVCSVRVTASIVSICTGVIGYMTWWGVNIGTISMINIIMCIGYPIAQGALSTILGVVALGFSASYIFRAFFKTMFLVILLGAFHGMLVIPALLSFIGPKSMKQWRSVSSEQPSVVLSVKIMCPLSVGVTLMPTCVALVTIYILSCSDDLCPLSEICVFLMLIYVLLVTICVVSVMICALSVMICVVSVIIYIISVIICVLSIKICVLSVMICDLSVMICVLLMTICVLLLTACVPSVTICALTMVARVLFMKIDVSQLAQAKRFHY